MTSLSFPYVHVDRGSLHVVEHHDDLFFRKKNTTIIPACQYCISTDVKILLNVVVNCLCQSTMFSLCWLRKGLCCVTLELIGSTFSICFLHWCWVSTAALLMSQGGQGLAWVARPTYTLFPGLAPCFPGPGTFPIVCQAQYRPYFQINFSDYSCILMFGTFYYSDVAKFL